MGRGFTALAVVCAGMALAGCGSKSGDSTSGGVKQPKPTQPVSAVIPLFNKAIADQSCDEFARLDFSLTRQTTVPGAPATGNECTYFKQALTALKGFKFTRGAEYGTAALLEGPASKAQTKTLPGGRGVEFALLVLDRDGRYRYLYSNTTNPQIGTKPSSDANDGGKNAQAVVDAVRSKDCAKLVPLIHPQGSIGHQFNGRTKEACQPIVNGRIFAPSIRESKDAKPVLLGATRDFQFYGVSTKKSYFTLILDTPPGTSDKPPLLFELVPNTDNPAIPKGQKG